MRNLNTLFNPTHFTGTTHKGLEERTILVDIKSVNLNQCRLVDHDDETASWFIEKGVQLFIVDIGINNEDNSKSVALLNEKKEIVEQCSMGGPFDNLEGSPDDVIERRFNTSLLKISKKVEELKAQGWVELTPDVFQRVAARNEAEELY